MRVWSGAQDISGYISTLVSVNKYIKIHVALIMSIYQNSCHANYEDSNIYITIEFRVIIYALVRVWSGARPG